MNINIFKTLRSYTGKKKRKLNKLLHTFFSHIYYPLKHHVDDYLFQVAIVSKILFLRCLEKNGINVAT